MATNSITSYESKPLQLNRKITSPGSFEYIKFKVAGKEFLHKVVSVVIFEDLEKPYVTGEIICLDTENYPSTIPLIGGEDIEFSIRDCYSVIEDYKVRLTKVSDRNPESLGSLSYSLHFTTDIGILTSMRKISKAYRNTKPNDIIQDILLNYLTLENRTPNFDYVDTANPISCVIPNWRPAHALKWIASRSIASRQDHKNSPYTIFQERNGKLNLLPLDFLYDESTNVKMGEMTIKHSRTSDTVQLPSLVSDPRMSTHILSFEEFNIVKTTDFVENLINGMYRNKVQPINMFARANEPDVYGYAGTDDATGYSLSKHLNKYPFARDKMVWVEEPSHWRSIGVHDGMFDDMPADSKIDPFVPHHLSKWQQTEQMVVQGVLPGHFGLRVGQKYEIKIPRYQNVSTQTTQRMDEYFSGDYIIQTLKHEFASDNHYYATALMFTDSVSKKIEVIK